MRRLIRTVAALVLGAASLAGCGQQATTGAKPLKTATLELDFTPNAIHTGIYTAEADGYLHAAGVNLKVLVPGESTDAISLLVAHKVNFAILDIHDLAIADAQGKDLVGVMAIVERPLASVIAQPRYRTPQSLAGQTVGISGDPSDTAVLRSIYYGGLASHKPLPKLITVGYNEVPDLISHRVAAATGFWNDEGVELQHKGFHIFRVEDYGAPAYPELVLTVPKSELAEDPGLIRDTVGALSRGYQSVLADPSAGAHALEDQVSGLDSKQVSAQLQGELAAFKPAGGGPVGALEPGLLAKWARWEVQFGIVAKLPSIKTMFTQRFLPKS